MPTLNKLRISMSATMQLEEGELEDNSNDGLDPYTPLERPSLLSEIKETPREEESDRDSDAKYSSNSNSDSDDSFQPKRAKMRKLVKHPIRKNRNKYSVWCKEPNEHLTDFLGSFGMRHPKNDRNVENYCVPRKRKIPARKNDFESAELEPIFLDELEASETNSFEELAKDIAEKLSEKNYDLVLRIVIICGKEKAIEFYNRTRQMEQDGGMLIANQSRRRTSGGIFILLVRSNKAISKDQKAEIFEESNERSKLSRIKKRKMQRQQNFKDWLEKMNYEKEMESGQEELNNPPPSPEPHCPQPLPELRLRRDIMTYSDLNLNHSTDSEDAHCEDKTSGMPGDRETVNFDLSPGSGTLPTSPLKTNINNTSSFKQTGPYSSDSPLKRETVEYDDLYSMELIYD